MEGLGSNFTREELREIFKKMDWDRNGTISRTEFKSYLQEMKKGEEINMEEVMRAFKNMDKNQDNQISWDEFYEAMTTAAGQKSEVSEAEITKAFNSADMDSDGFVSRQEAKRAYKRLSKQFSRPIDSDTIEEWLEKADYDSDGRISLEEFKMGIAGNKLIGESLDIDVY